MINMRIESWNEYEIRFVEKEPNEWWAVAADVCVALDIKNTSQAVNGYTATIKGEKKHVGGLPEKHKGICTIYTLRGEQEALIS